MFYKIKSIYPDIKDSEFALQDDGDGPYIVEWTSTHKKPTSAQLKSADGSILQKAAQVRQQRAAAYPPVTDYLDAVVKGDTVAQQAYIDACLAIKAKYPK